MSERTQTATPNAWWEVFWCGAVMYVAGKNTPWNVLSGNVIARLTGHMSLGKTEFFDYRPYQVQSVSIRASTTEWPK